MSQLESIISTMMNAQETAETLNWHVADMLAEGKEKFGPGFAKEIAANTVWTTRHINSLIRVAETFQQEDRILDIPFRVHGICARTKDPYEWLVGTASNGWSERQLRLAIRASKDTGSTEERAAKKGDRIIKTVEEFHDEFGDMAEPHIRRLMDRLDDIND